MTVSELISASAAGPRRLLSRVVAISLIAGVIAGGSAQAQSSVADSGSTAAVPVSSLQIAVVGLRNDKGRVSCTLFNEPKAYPRGKEFREVWGPIHGDAGLCIFSDIPPGKYAAVVYQDENSNGHFDQNAFGLPLEGYGFSNNAAPLFDAPTFAAAAFNYDGQYLFTVINIRY